VAVQEVLRESVNRIQDSLDALCSQNNEAVAGHVVDALLVLTHHMADTEARRWAAYTGSDVLLRRRAAIQHGAAGSSVRDVMLSLAKKKSTVQSFFRLGGSGGQQQTPIQSPNLLPFTSFPLTLTQLTLQSIPASPVPIMVQQNREGFRTQVSEKKRRNNRSTQKGVG
jgi:hypothetical protein